MWWLLLLVSVVAQPFVVVSPFNPTTMALENAPQFPNPNVVSPDARLGSVESGPLVFGGPNAPIRLTPCILPVCENCEPIEDCCARAFDPSNSGCGCYWDPTIVGCYVNVGHINIPTVNVAAYLAKKSTQIPPTTVATSDTSIGFSPGESASA